MAKTKDELIDSHVSARQCKLAVDALLIHAQKVAEKKAEKQLLPGKEQNVWLQVTVKRMHPEKKLKPAKIPLVHPLVDPRSEAVCLITKDPQREYKDLLESHKIRFISRVVGITKLKGKFRPFEARRLLLKENGLFLADERVVPLLPNLLGSKFFQAKKQPIPVCLTRKDLKGELERAISSSYFHQNQGTCTSVKVGTLSQTPAQVLENLKMALPAIVAHIKGAWDNVQSLHIKANSSASLPIWSCELGTSEGARWDGLVAETDSESESADEEGGSESEMDVEEAAVKEVAAKEEGKGKKRVAEQEAEKPKKKAKADTTSEPEVAVPSTGKVSKLAQKAKVSVPETASAIDLDVPVKKTKKRKTVAAEDDAVGNPEIAMSTVKVSKLPQKHNASAPEAEAAVAVDIVDIPAKKTKKRKMVVLEDETPAVISADIPKPSAGPSKVVSTEQDTSAETTGKKEKKKRRRNLAAPDTSATFSSSPALQDASRKTDAVVEAPPVTPSVSKKKKSRSLAADFFEDGESAGTPLAPPNTPADGLAPQTPVSSLKKRRRAKGVEATPVSSAIAKLAAEEHTDDTPASNTKTKGASEPTETAEEAHAVPKHRNKKSKAPAEEAVSATESGRAGVTKEELKVKRSAAGIERKKEKVLGGKQAGKSAKDAVIGKKRV
ncbi:ribosomal protein L1p/L10e family-domain-containing protein [Amylocystis lapponica]|nr:ribosomal protein L1p/L10e family-domain-containing protein [Amylocystis lapponica]